MQSHGPAAKIKTQQFCHSPNCLSAAHLQSPLPSPSTTGQHRSALSWQLCLKMTVCVCCVRSVAWSCPTLCSPTDCSPPGSSVRVFQARILERIPISYSRGSSRPRDRTRVSCNSCTAGRFFITSVTWEAPKMTLIEIEIISCQNFHVPMAPFQPFQRKAQSSEHYHGVWGSAMAAGRCDQHEASREHTSIHHSSKGRAITGARLRMLGILYNEKTFNTWASSGPRIRLRTSDPSQMLELRLPGWG